MLQKKILSDISSITALSEGLGTGLSAFVILSTRAD